MSKFTNQDAQISSVTRVDSLLSQEPDLFQESSETLPSEWPARNEERPQIPKFEYEAIGPHESASESLWLRINDLRSTLLDIPNLSMAGSQDRNQTQICHHVPSCIPTLPPNGITASYRHGPTSITHLLAFPRFVSTDTGCSPRDKTLTQAINGPDPESQWRTFVPRFSTEGTNLKALKLDIRDFSIFSSPPRASFDNHERGSDPFSESTSTSTFTSTLARSLDLLSESLDHARKVAAYRCSSFPSDLDLARGCKGPNADTDKQEERDRKSVDDEMTYEARCLLYATTRLMWSAQFTSSEGSEGLGGMIDLLDASCL